MAKSKNGGTRSLIRGRVGSDVYSVGKDGAGKRQQVVRSLAESVANPRTESQMFGRMVMSTVMQAVSKLSPIIDHSFDGLPKGQPSISEFIRLNYALVKADALAHPSGSNTFGLNKYQEKGAKIGKYIVSKGQLAPLTGIVGAGNEWVIALTADTMTVGGLKAATGMQAGDYFTIVVIADDGNAYFTRVSLADGVTDATAISAGTLASIFVFDGNVTCTPSIATNSVVFSLGFSSSDSIEGVILSRTVDGAWKHSTCTLDGSPSNFNWKADAALPTYPTGAENYLNGGDL